MSETFVPVGGASSRSTKTQQSVKSDKKRKNKQSSEEEGEKIHALDTYYRISHNILCNPVQYIYI